MNKRLYALIVATAVIASGIICCPEPPSFSVKVVPERMDDAIPGQKCVLLVTIEGEPLRIDRGSTFNISASAPDAEVTVQPQTITADQVSPKSP